MPTLTPDQLRIARRQQSLETGLTTRELGQQRRFEALLHVYRFGWTSPSLIDRWHGSGNHRGLCAKLVKNGLLRESKTTSGGLGLIGTPTKFVTLTALGIEAVESYPKFDAENYLRENYQLSPSKYNQNKFRHDHIVQQLTMRYVLNDYFICGIEADDYLTENELNSRSESEKKQFDAIWMQPAHTSDFGDDIPERRCGVEVELSQKSGLKLDLFAYKIVKSLHNGDVDFVAIFSESEYLLKKYREKFEEGSVIKTPNGGSVRLTDAYYDRVIPAKITEEMLRESRAKKNWLAAAQIAAYEDEEIPDFG